MRHRVSTATTSVRRGMTHLLVWLALSIVAIAVGFAYALDVVIPLKPAIVLFAAISIWGVARQSITPLSLLPRLSVVLYAVCFSATAGHLFSGEYVWWTTPAASRLIRDEQVGADMMATGLVGLLGLLAGMHLRQAFAARQPDSLRRPTRTLGPWAFLVAVAAAVLLSWMVAPGATILTQAYNTGGAASAAAPLNFNSAYLISYLILILLYVDAESERITDRRRLKFGLLATSTLFIVAVLQILRGDRESASLLVGIAFLYLTAADRSLAAARLAVLWPRIRRTVLPAFALLMIFIAVGPLRSRLSDADERGRGAVLAAISEAARENTWTAVLLTNLGQAGQFRAGTAEYLYGQTYLDYLLSTPPGIVTRLVGVDRPLEADRGPSWWFSGFSAGGIHVVVVPFRNFGMFGAYLILMGIGFFIASVELANTRYLLWTRFLYGAVTVATFFWFWYGDMYIIRGLMGVALLLPLYNGWLHITGTWNEALRARQAVGDLAAPDNLPQLHP